MNCFCGRQGISLPPRTPRLAFVPDFDRYGLLVEGSAGSFVVGFFYSKKEVADLDESYTPYTLQRIVGKETPRSR